MPTITADRLGVAAAPGSHYVLDGILGNATDLPPTKAHAPFIKCQHMPGAGVRTDKEIRESVRQ